MPSPAPGSCRATATSRRRSRTRSRTDPGQDLRRGAGRSPRPRPRSTRRSPASHGDRSASATAATASTAARAGTTVAMTSAALRARRTGSAALGGARRLRVHRHPDAAVPRPATSARSSTRSTSASGSGTSAPAPSTFIGLANYQTALNDPIFQRAIQNSLYYAVIWVPLTMAIGLFLAVIVNQKIRGRTFFRAAFYFPAIASSAAITMLWIFLVAPDGLFNERPRRRSGSNPLFDALRLRPEPELDRRPAHGAELGDPPERLDDVGHVHALLPGVAPVDQRRGLRGGRDRRRERLADVLARSPSRCSGPATTSWRRSRSSARSSCSTRRSSPAGRAATRTTP